MRMQAAIKDTMLSPFILLESATLRNAASAFRRLCILKSAIMSSLPMRRQFPARRRPAFIRVRNSLAILSLLFPLSLSAQPSSHALPLLTHAAQVRQLSPEDAARGYPVQ